MESALYGIYALVVFVSEILLVRCAHSFDFWYVNNSCVNTVRQHFPWSILYICNEEHIVDKPLLSCEVDSRLRKYTRDANIDSGETLYSFRSGCALTLAFPGSPLADVISHVGWSSSKTAFNYLNLADVFRAGAPADLLASAPSQSQEASRIYDDYNSVKDFVSAFPVSNSSSFKRALPPLFSLCLMASSSFQFWGV